MKLLKIISLLLVIGIFPTILNSKNNMNIEELTSIKIQKPDNFIKNILIFFDSINPASPHFNKSISSFNNKNKKDVYKFDYRGYSLNKISVKQIQSTLNNYGYNLTIDGILGNKSKEKLDELLKCNDVYIFNREVHKKLINSSYRSCNGKKIAKSEKDNSKNEVFSRYDGIITGNSTTKVVMCKYPGLGKCREDHILRNLKEGDEFLVTNYLINFKCNHFVKIKFRNDNGYITNNYKIYKPEKFYDASVLIKDERGSCKESRYSNETESILVYEGPGESVNGKNIVQSNKVNSNKENTNTNYSNNTSKVSSTKNKCSGLNDEKSWVYKGLTGFFSKKDACLKISSYSDDKICSKIKKGKDDILNAEESWYQKEISSRGMVCIDGFAFDKSDSSTKTLKAIQKLEEKIDNQPKYKEVCRNEKVLGERLDGSTYSKTIRNCKNVKIKTNEQILNEAIGGAIMSIFD